MRRFFYLLIASIGMLGVVVGLARLNIPIVVAPPIETPNSVTLQIPPAKSLKQLYQMRAHLQTELKQSNTIFSRAFSAPTKQLLIFQAVEIQIQVEETAKKRWERAIQLAAWARELQGTPNPSIKLLANIRSLWQQAISSLQAVPQGSFLTERATLKGKEYKTYLASASYKLDTASSGFLKPIAERTGLPPANVRITVCHISGECRRWHGTQPPASPASLIKVPIAIALMQKVTTENISLDTKIQVSRNNYTEDASNIRAGEKYTLRQMLMRMIDQSSNIATNQLIDYLGRDYINQILRDRGYKFTQVNSKLVGESTYPSNLGSGVNQITTDELTEMIVQIYNLEHSGDEVLIEALASQNDKLLGYNGLKNSTAIWIGEKTGRNSSVLGTTLVMNINNESYVLSVVLNSSSDQRAIRRCINDIAKYIRDRGHL